MKWRLLLELQLTMMLLIWEVLVTFSAALIGFDGSIDAWTELKPIEIGWTYDTKANPMLSANRKLQKRLDRFMVSLHDLKVESINMVGMRRVPEVTYMKQRKGKPDLASEHSGLLASDLVDQSFPHCR
ncbi:endonuclease/exonuclease/phosphatase family protein [Tanacetum coccineum]